MTKEVSYAIDVLDLLFGAREQRMVRGLRTISYGRFISRYNSVDESFIHISRSSKAKSLIQALNLDLPI